MMAALKSLSVKSNICVSLVYVYWLSFLISVEMILVLGTKSSFLLYPGHFGSYVVKLQILSPSSVLKASSDTVPLGKGDSLRLSGGV